MHNALTILRDDLRAIRTNTITALIVFGVLIIPLIFTTFNVLASWDPFGNTSNLRIAVASNDKGHTTDVGKLNVNLGDQVLSQLARNDSVDWVITDSADAVEGTRSGDYYASIVLPESFSDDMLTFYLDGAEPTRLDLYTNQKKNALSSSITSKVATGVTTNIDESFAEVLSSVGLGLLSSLDDYLNEEDTQSALNTIQSRVQTTGGRLNSASATVRSLTGLIDGAIPLATSADSLLSRANRSDSTAPTTQSSSPVNLDATLRESADALSSALTAASSSLGTVSARLDDATGTNALNPDELHDLATQVRSQAKGLDTARGALAGLALPTTQFDSAAAQARALADSLDTTATALETGAQDTSAAAQRARDAVDRASRAVEDARTSYTTDLKPQVAELSQSIAAVADDVATVRADLDAARANAAGADSLASRLESSRDEVGALADKLAAQSAEFERINSALDDARQTGDLDKLARVVGDDPGLTASRLASPLGLDREPVFAVKSFGAAMTPFYTTLALWVGALIACVFIYTNAERIYRRGETSMSRNAIFFGRFLTFALIALVQSTLVTTGLIFFVEIAPQHPIQLIVVGWVIALVFMLLVYALVVTFDNAGKAIAVVLLVIQVSGAGGSYPLPLLPEFFQKVSPWLPATHAISALRAAIAGSYEGDLWRELCLLVLFTIPALVLGLWLRRLMDGYHARLSAAIASTKVMAS